LTVIVHHDEKPEKSHIGELRQLEIAGQDRPGIISQISSALASESVNVEDLQTECSSAAMSGETLFIARARLFIPERVDISDLRKKLEKIGEDLIVDVSIKEVEGDPVAQ
jgi:glycine cleavage system regulatory protein